MIQRFGLRGILMAALLSFVLPSDGIAAVEENTLNQVYAEQEFSRVERAYSDMDRRYSRIGTPRSISQVNRVALGQTKADLQTLLGQPAIIERGGAWEFHLALPLTGRNELVCQYRVHFDQDERVQATVWRRPQCAELVLDGRN